MTKKEYETIIEALEKLEESIVMKFDAFNDEITRMTGKFSEDMNTLFKPESCEHCDGTGKVTVGEFDNIEERNCTLCNPKETVEEQMDDNS